MKKFFLIFLSLLLISCFDIFQEIDGQKDYISIKYHLKIPKTLQNILKIDIKNSENYATFINENFTYSKKLQKSSSKFKLLGIPNSNYYEYFLDIEANNRELADAGYINKNDSFFPNVSENYIIIPIFYPNNFDEKYIDKNAYFDFLLTMSNWTIVLSKRRMKTINKISFVGDGFIDDISYTSSDDKWIINVPLKKWFATKKKAEIVIQR